MEDAETYIAGIQNRTPVLSFGIIADGAAVGVIIDQRLYAAYDDAWPRARNSRDP